MKRIPGFPNYSVTKDGRVWSHKRLRVNGGWLKSQSQASGHLYVGLYKNGKMLNKRIHRLVLEVFVGPCPPGLECRHLNGNPADNKLKNLKWGTAVENRQDSIRHGTLYLSGKFGERHPGSKLSDQDRRLISSMYRSGYYIQQELADHFGIARSQISQITSDARWAGAIS